MKQKKIEHISHDINVDVIWKGVVKTKQELEKVVLENLK